MSSDAKSVVFMALFLAKYNIYHLINLEFLRKFLVPDEKFMFSALQRNCGRIELLRLRE